MRAEQWTESTDGHYIHIKRDPMCFIQILLIVCVWAFGMTAIRWNHMCVSSSGQAMAMPHMNVFRTIYSNICETVTIVIQTCICSPRPLLLCRNRNEEYEQRTQPLVMSTRLLKQNKKKKKAKGKQTINFWLIPRQIFNAMSLFCDQIPMFFFFLFSLLHSNFGK